MKKTIFATALALGFGAAAGGVGYAVTNNYNQANIKDLNTQIEQKETVNADQRQEISGLNKSINSLAMEKDNLIAENNNKSESIKNLQSDIENKQTQIENLQKDMTAKSNKIETLNSQISSNNTQISNLQADIDEKKAEIARLEAEGEDNTATINSLNADIQNKQTQISNLTADVATKTSELNDLQTRFDELEEKCSNYYYELDQSKARVTELENEIATNSTTINDLNTQLTQKQSELAALQLSINEKDETISKLENFSPKKQYVLSDGNICYYDDDFIIYNKVQNKYFKVSGIKNFEISEGISIATNSYLFISDKCPSALLINYNSNLSSYIVYKRIYVGLGQKSFINTPFGVGIKNSDDRISWHSNNTIVEKMSDGNYVSINCTGSSLSTSYIFDVKTQTYSGLNFKVLEICNLLDGIHTLVSTLNSDKVYKFYLYDAENGFVPLDTDYNCILTHKLASANEKLLMLLKSGCVVYTAPGKIMKFDPSDNSFSVLYNDTTAPTRLYGCFYSTDNYVYLNTKVDGKQILINQNTNAVSFIDYKNTYPFMYELPNGNLVGCSSNAIYCYDFESSTWNLISSIGSSIHKFSDLGNYKVLVNTFSGSTSSTFVVDILAKTKTSIISDSNFWGLDIRVNDNITILYSGLHAYGIYTNGSLKSTSMSCGLGVGIKIYNSSTGDVKSYFENDGFNSLHKKANANITFNIAGLNYTYNGETFVLDL